jgi:hypothetical protein
MSEKATFITSCAERPSSPQAVQTPEAAWRRAEVDADHERGVAPIAHEKDCAAGSDLFELLQAQGKRQPCAIASRITLYSSCFLRKILKLLKKVIRVLRFKF